MGQLLKVAQIQSKDFLLAIYIFNVKGSYTYATAKCVLPQLDSVNPTSSWKIDNFSVSMPNF